MLGTTELHRQPFLFFETVSWEVTEPIFEFVTFLPQPSESLEFQVCATLPSLKDSCQTQ